MLSIDVGPKHDIRTFNLEFPKLLPITTPKHLRNIYYKTHNLVGNKNVGVLVSGGIDSAILYYLLVKVNLEQNLNFIITPYTMLRAEAGKYHALSVINYVQEKFNLTKTKLNVVGDNSLPDIEQVESATRDVIKNQNDYVYLAMISRRPEHSIGVKIYNFVSTIQLRYPLINLEKNHVIDLFIKFDVLDLIELTNSCRIENIKEPCGFCNGCAERQWGLKEMSLL